MTSSKKILIITALAVIAVFITAVFLLSASSVPEHEDDGYYRIMGTYGPPFEEQNINLVMEWKNTLLTSDKTELWNQTQSIYPGLNTSRWYFSDSGYIVLLVEKENPPTQKEMDAVYTIWNAAAVRDGAGSLPLKFETAPPFAYQYRSDNSSSPSPTADISEQQPPVSQNFSGRGNTLIDAVYLHGIITVLAEVSGDGPFILSLQDEKGKQNILFTESRPFTTAYPEYFFTAAETAPGNYTLSIVSSGDWNVSLHSGEQAYYSIGESISSAGFGSQTIPLPRLPAGLAVLKGYGTAPGEISADLIVNGEVVRRMHTDPSGLIGFQAAYLLSPGDTAAVDIISDGEWMFAVTQPLPVSPPRFEKISGTGDYVSSFYWFGDVQNQELAFSNAGSSPVTAVLYAADGSVLSSVVIPAKTDAYHYRFFQTEKQILPFTALIEVTAENSDRWLIEQCGYQVYFDQLSKEEVRVIPETMITHIREEDLTEFSVLKRFAETKFTARCIPASESEIKKLMTANCTTVEFAGTYYAIFISD